MDEIANEKEIKGGGSFLIKKNIEENIIEEENEPTFKERLSHILYSKHFWIFYAVIIIICLFLLFWVLYLIIKDNL
jgi:hypothetical protein